MSITNTWAINQMDCHPEANGETDVVFNVHWTLTASDGTYQGYAYGSQSLTFDPEMPFIAYNDLTEAQVIGWVKAALGEEQVAAYELSVANEIADQVNPPMVTPQLPWSA